MGTIGDESNLDGHRCSGYFALHWGIRALTCSQIHTSLIRVDMHIYIYIEIHGETRKQEAFFLLWGVNTHIYVYNRIDIIM